MVSFFCLSRGLQELWAADTLQVQEFMFNFLRDPLREIDEPYFSLDEVRRVQRWRVWRGWSRVCIPSAMCAAVTAPLSVSSLPGGRA